MRISVKTFQHLEPLVVEELQQMGATQFEVGRRIVHCEGDWEIVYRANYEMRTALRVLIPIHSFHIRRDEDLYARAVKFDWEEFLDVDQTFAIDPAIFSDHFRHPHFASLRLKDAMADFFTKKYARRPDVNVRFPDVLFHLHIDQDKVTISMDSSGSSLNQRGYRNEGGAAPINEVLAAGMLLSASWNGEKDLVDPFCGSGTIAIEAAMMAAKIPAQFNRKRFGFMSWKSFQEPIWLAIERKAEARIVSPPCRIHASDRDAKQLELAKKNAASAGVENFIDFQQKDFFDIEPEVQEGVIITNPPYGERLDEQDMTELFGKIGTRLKHHWPGWSAWFISSSPAAFKSVGLRPTRKMDMMNGPLECKFMKFDLFKGKKGHAQE
jgi:putative N6-adenine-specific DNA methylase